MKTNNTNKDKKPTTPLTPQQKKKQFIIKGLKWFWGLFFGGILSIVLLFLFTSWGLFGSMPDVRELESPDIYVASQIISSDGQIIGKFEKEKRIPVEYKDLPPQLVYALLAKEDERFREHSGIDQKALFRAIRYMGSRGGGSTISQQLAKLLFTDDPASNKIERAFQKLKEMIIAVKLEKLYTKEEIITMYLNKFDFLYNAKGIETASQVYFNKHTKDLTLPECATFIAMLENPSLNNPKRNPAKAKERRNVVLQQMLKLKFISDEEYNSVASTDVKIDYRPVKEVGEGYSAYFKYALQKEVNAVLEEYEKQTDKKYDLYKDGLKIYVTLDSRMQQYAEEAIEKHVRFLQSRFNAEQRGRQYAPFYQSSIPGSMALPQLYAKLMTDAMRRTGRYKLLKQQNKSEEEIMADFRKPIDMQVFSWNGERDTIMSPWDSIRYHKHIVQAGIMAMEPNTGNIKAWVGGIDWKHFQYDHVKQSRRQVGSTFKPFVYATAIKQLNYTPCTVISNAPFTIGNWSPKNSGGGSGGSLTLRDALAKSVNIVAARLIAATGYDAVIQMARDLGVESNMPKNYTIALGSSQITIYEMLGAYSTFANFGNYIKPEMIWRIEDNNGKVIKEYQPQVREVMSEVYAYTMIDLMKGVIDRGTGRGLRGMGITAEVAGKTGTTNDNADGWFIGITPKLAAGVWVGWEDQYAHFRSTGEGQGAKMALPIWGYFMSKVYSNASLKISQKDKFPKPESIGADWNCGSLASYGSYGDTDGDIFSIGSGSGNHKEEGSVNSKIRRKDSINFNED